MSDTGLTRLFLGAAVALMSSAAARAADVSGSQGVQLDEVVVTATRTETNLQKTPVAVTALSAEALEERGAHSLLDIGSFTPSLSVVSRSGAGATQGGYSIRGIGVDAPASQPGVGLYVDDVYYSSRAGNLLGLYDIGRVEVLRGPQGTLFGRNTIAGAIQYVSRKPEQRLGGYIDAIGGSFHRADFQGAVNVPIGETLAIRLSGASLSRGGYVHDDLNNVERGAERTWEVRLQARWTPTDRLTVDLKGETAHQRTNGRAVTVAGVNPNAQFVGLAECPPPPPPNAPPFTFCNPALGETRPLTAAYISTGKYQFAGFNDPDYFHLDHYVVQGVINYRVKDNISVKSITAYSQTRTLSVIDFDQTPLSILSLPPSPPIVDDQFTEEVQLTGRFLNDRISGTAGYFYYNNKAAGELGEHIMLGYALEPFAGRPNTAIVSNALYGQLSFQITDQLSVDAGLRYSTERNTGYTTLPSGQNGAKTTASFKNVSPLIGVNMQFTPDILAYAKASRGFRAGGQTIDPRFPNGFLPFGPETAWTYEAGLRMEMLDHRLRLNPTVFFTNWAQIQNTLIVPQADAILVAVKNAGSAHIKGAELEGQFAATDRLLLTASASYLDGHYTQVSDQVRSTVFPAGFHLDTGVGVFLPPLPISVRNLFVTTPLPRMPKYKLSLGARYTQPLADGSKLVFFADYSFVDKQRSAVTETESVDLLSYNLVNARIQWDSANGKYSVAAFATNLTNTYYLIGGANFAKGYTAGTVELDPARPRELGIQLTARY